MRWSVWLCYFGCRFARQARASPCGRPSHDIASSSSTMVHSNSAAGSAVDAEAAAVAASDPPSGAEPQGAPPPDQEGGRIPMMVPNAAAAVAASMGAETLSPHLYSVSQAGRRVVYGSQRRWIGLATGWTRLGAGATELDSRIASSQSTGPDLFASNAQAQGLAARALLAQLCEKFYNLGWAPGTGAGATLRVRSPVTQEWRVFVTPSGLQKEDMIGEDMYELDMQSNVVEPPQTPNLRLSASTSLSYIVFEERPTATCLLHTHSINSVMATVLDPTETSKTFKVTHQEMLKGVGHHAYDDMLEIPIIDNRPSEDLLGPQLREAMRAYPKANAVLVRRHGVYVWGDSWEQAKTQLESFDYLFGIAIEMKKIGLDAAIPPQSGTFRVEKEDGGNGRPIKRARKTEGFHGMAASENQVDLERNAVPILPRDAKILLLDIEGTTSSIAFVKDTLFPYVRHQLTDFVKNHVSSDELASLCEGLATEVQAAGGEVTPEMRQQVDSLVYYLMDRDIKAATLKGLQGRMWKAGYEAGKLKGHVYADFKPMLEWMKANEVDVYIYSSGSIQAQKLLFANSVEGDLLPFLQGHFDIPTAGNKKQAASYTKIAQSLGVDPSQIVFVSDAEAELKASREAGITHSIMSVRPGNAPLTEYGMSLPTVYSLLQLCGK